MQLGPLALEKLKGYQMLAAKQGFQSAVLDQCKTAMSNIEERNKKPDYSKMTTRELLACHDEGANDQLRYLLRRKKTSARDLQRDLKAMDIDMEDVPNGALPWPLRAGPSSDTSEECDGWRRELDDSEVAESYMDAKFGGEDADMVEIVGGW